MTSNEELQGIPTVDISAFTPDGSASSRERTAQDIARSCRTHGCIGITGHGVPPSLLAQAFATAQKLFDLPLEDKMKAPHPDGMTPHRGYSAASREQGAAKAAEDTDDRARKEELIKIKDYKVCFSVSARAISEIRLHQRIAP